MASDDGQKFLLNQPAPVDALQKMQDLRQIHIEQDLQLMLIEQVFLVL